jgi:homoserine kinase type II
MELNKKDIDSILKSYHIGSAISYKKAKEGVVNHNWIIKTTKGTYILRLISHFRKLSEILFEHEFLTGLKKQSFPYEIPYPLTTTNGKTLVKFKRRYVWVYKFIHGKTSAPINIPKIKEIAKMMAVSHEMARRITIKHKRNWPNSFELDWLVKEINKSKKHILSKKKLDRKDRFFLSKADEVVNVFQNIPAGNFSKLKKIPVHGDANNDNLIFKNNKLVGILDYDDARLDSKVRDIALFLQAGCRTKDRTRLDFNKARIFIREYRKHAKLNAKELYFAPSIIISMNADSFWWCYYVLEHDKGRILTLKNMQRAYKRVVWYGENRSKLEQFLMGV